MAWRERLSQLVRLAPHLEPPDSRFRVRPPSGLAWPAELPAGGTLPQFYGLCDGGVFPDVMNVSEVFPLDRLGERSRELEARLRAALEPEDRVSPYVRGRHVVFGWDTVGGIYLIWDAVRDELVGYMPHDDHDWHDHESGHPPSLAAFFEEVFSTAPCRVGSPLSAWWVGLLASLVQPAEPVAAPDPPI